jgi:hypothetical protein
VIKSKHGTASLVRRGSDEVGVQIYFEDSNEQQQCVTKWLKKSTLTTDLDTALKQLVKDCDADIAKLKKEQP